MSKKRERVIQILKGTEVSRADMDELIILILGAKDQYPEKFITVINDFDKKYTNLDYEQRNFKERLLRILDTYENFEIEFQPKITTTDELEPTFIIPNKDKKHVLELCEKMRKIILATHIFDEPHKILLLNRVAGIEYQIHQPKGKLDIIRGAVSDVGETLLKFGKDLKPLTDRMNDVLRITRKGSKQYDQIPAPEEIKQIEDQSDEDESE